MGPCYSIMHFLKGGRIGVGVSVFIQGFCIVDGWMGSMKLFYSIILWHDMWVGVLYPHRSRLACALESLRPG